MDARYLIALGSNQRHVRHGSPARVLRAALVELARGGLMLEAAAPMLATPPLGPSRRRYANTAALVRTGLEPEVLLRRLKEVERRFGRRGRGERWRARVLDLDIILWEGGCWSSRRLTIPHPDYRTRSFVLSPALRLAADWPDPLTGLTIRHLHARLTRPRPLPIAASGRGP